MRTKRALSAACLSLALALPCPALADSATNSDLALTPGANAPSAASTDPAITETLLAVTINGTPVSDGTILLRYADGTYAISLEDARAWRLLLAKQATEMHQGRPFVPLRLLPDVSARFDEAQQRLDLTIPAKYFEKTHLDEGAQTLLAPERGRGSFLNYDVRGQSFSGQAALVNASLNSGTTIGHGVLDNGFVGNAGSGTSGLRRVSSSWQQDDVARRTSLRLGDSTSNPGALITGEPFFGVQFLSNFATTPGLIVNPRPSVAGALNSPSTADVYVDGRLVLQQQLPSGPFQIDNIPTYGDVGSVQVIVKNAGGQQQILATPYYGPSTLLKAGLTKFAWGAGLEGTYTSTGTERYGAPLAEMFEQLGFNDRFTGELDAMLAPDGRALSGGGVWLVPKLGTLDLALSAGSGTGSGGTRFDYEYLGRGIRFGFGISSLLQTSTAISTPGVIQTGSVTHESDAHVSLPLNRLGSLNFTLRNQNATLSGAIRTLQASYFTRVGRSSQLNLNVFKTSGAIVTNAATLGLLVPLDGCRRYAVTAGTQEGGGATETLSLTSDPTLDGSGSKLGYTLTAGQGDLGAQLTSWTPSVDLTAGFSRVAGTSATQFDARGSIASLGGHVFASRSILGAYGVAEVPGYPHVRVYANNQFVGTTDKRGKVLVPNLQAYQKNTISLESKDFPIASNVDSFSKTAVPYSQSPVLVRFPVRGEGGLIIHVKLPDGTYFPQGGTLSTDGVSWPVADQGEAYLEGLEPGAITLQGAAGDTHCRIVLTAPKNMKDIPDLGEVICR